MRFPLRALTTTALAASLASTACAPSVGDGAARIYAAAEICPHDGITVKERSDVAPHTVLQGVPTPPGVDIDSITSTYEITGCGKDVLYVCGRPVVGNHADPFSVAVSTPDAEGPRLAMNTPYFTETRAIDVDGNRNREHGHVPAGSAGRLEEVTVLRAALRREAARGRRATASRRCW
jgi:hypothetical protein